MPQEAERLHVLMRDIDKWNGLSEEDRAKWLHQDKWGAFNKLASMLTDAEVKTLQTHTQFNPLRDQFTVCVFDSSVDEVRKCTDLFYKAVKDLR